MFKFALLLLLLLLFGLNRNYILSQSSRDRKSMNKLVIGLASSEASAQALMLPVFVLLLNVFFVWCRSSCKCFSLLQCAKSARVETVILSSKEIKSQAESGQDWWVSVSSRPMSLRPIWYI